MEDVLMFIGKSLFGLVLIPICVYLCVKFGVIGFYCGRQCFFEECDHGKR